MTKEYIEREAATRILTEAADAYGTFTTERGIYLTAREKVQNIPAADVEEVKHGKWIGKQLDNFRKYEVTCSNCDWIGIENYDSYDNPFEFNYCPSCGTKMDLED